MTGSSIENYVHGGRGLVGFDEDGGLVVGWPELAHESIRAINHLNSGPAPVEITIGRATGDSDPMAIVKSLKLLWDAPATMRHAKESRETWKRALESHGSGLGRLVQSSGPHRRAISDTGHGQDRDELPDEPGEPFNAARAERVEAELSRDYASALDHLDQAEWEVAKGLLESLQRLQPGYRDTHALLLRAKTEIHYAKGCEAQEAKQWNKAIWRLFTKESG